MTTAAGAPEGFQSLYRMEAARLQISPALRRTGVMILAVLVIAAPLGAVGAGLRTLVGLATLLGVGLLPPLSALIAVTGEWSAGTAVWWLALPQPGWARLAAKAARGVALGWGVAVIGGLTFLVQGAAQALRPLDAGAAAWGLVGGTRGVLFLAVLAIPLAALGVSLGLWIVRLRLLRGVRAVLTGAATGAALLVAASTFVAASTTTMQNACGGIHLSPGLALPLAPVLVGCLLIAGGGVWAARWLDHQAEDRGPGRS